MIFFLNKRENLNVNYDGTSEYGMHHLKQASCVEPGRLANETCRSELDHQVGEITWLKIFWVVMP